MKKLLITLLIGIAVFMQNPSSILTASASDYSGFDVSEVLVVPDSTSGEESSILDSLNSKVDTSGEVSSPLVAGILRVINILMLLIGTFAFVTLFYGGIMMMSGEENQIDRAKTLITQAIMGLVVAFLSYFIVTFVQSFFY